MAQTWEDKTLQTCVFKLTVQGVGAGHLKTPGNFPQRRWRRALQEGGDHFSQGPGGTAGRPPLLGTDEGLSTGCPAGGVWASGPRRTPPLLPPRTWDMDLVNQHSELQPDKGTPAPWLSWAGQQGWENGRFPSSHSAEGPGDEDGWEAVLAGG